MRKESDAQLRLAATIFNSATEAIMIVDLDTKILSINPAFITATGYTEEEVIGKTPQILQSGRHDKTFYKDMWRKIKATGHWEGEIWNRRKNGEIYPEWLSIASVRNEEGNVVQYTGLFMDITEQKRNEAERDNLITDLENKNAEMERFTYTISHDLKSPLITIASYIKLIREALSKGETERIKPDLLRISEAANTMKELLDNLLELSRIGRFTHPPEVIALTPVALKATEMLAGVLERRKVQVEIGTNLPIATVDPVRIREVFTNLLENAAKFMGDQDTPLIKIKTRMDKGIKIICITDNGIGIDPCYHENIFGLFNRLDQETEGTGVGLALVKRIIEVHGGRIWVESKGEGHGSTFCIALPESKNKNQEKGKKQ